MTMSRDMKLYILQVIMITKNIADTVGLCCLKACPFWFFHKRILRVRNFMAL